MRAVSIVACISIICVALLPSCKKAKTGKSVYSEYAAAVQKGIKKTIDDKNRRNRLLALHAEGNLQQLDLAFIYAATGVEMRSKINLTREEAEQILVDAEEKRARAFKEMSETRREMRELLSQAEWEKIFIEPAKKAKEKKE